ncbi:hypothetical protein Runsl_5808 (plasmid) [Runella slithyformis DSM 19594]|uniref:Uncharacterized protein n=2 Tax=Runella TaxID=105 RepID=A0A7U3ZRV7_RUNSL|nr:hypothetical protein [Runella slithyformis]AEI52215.1 hypothetical protein Runsl_5808 [Runella slithyformis DSM 19594]
MDIDFVPHIGVGNTLNASQYKDWVDTWNTENFEIKGRNKRLSIVCYENDVVTQ